MPITIKLYTTLGCHLCEDALDLLNQYSMLQKKLVIEKIEISESDRLIESYGIRIPVIQKAAKGGKGGKGKELGWPFDMETLTQYLGED